MGSNDGMVDKHTQIKKLAYDKKINDSGEGYRWRVSTTKVSLWLVAGILILIGLYSFFVESQGDFLKSTLFYGIVILIVFLIGWVVFRIIMKSRKLFSGFLLAWILILGVLIAMHLILDAWLGMMSIHFGTSVYMTITALAMVGANRIDGSLDRNDIFYALLVFVILVVGQYPLFEHGGFYAELDYIIGWFVEKIPFLTSAL